jgi:hypothetical protein
MDPQIDAALAHVNALMRRGRAIADRIALDCADAIALTDARIWQHDCAAAISQLSGGSKAHWLSRAYSGALLVRASDGGAMVEASVAEIVARVVAVLQRAAESLMQPEAVAATPPAAPAARRFDFVRHEPLRPVLEQAYVESDRALRDGDYTTSFMTTCSILESVITDALDSSDRTADALDSSDRTAVAAMSFSDRIAAAEARRVIHGQCARLPAIAWNYRLIGESTIVTRRDAVVARQVLHVVLRDLDPGR